MKIINFEEFAKLPEGVLFSYYLMGSFRGLNQKGATIYDESQPIDYFETYLMPLELGADIEVGVTMRWGEYDYEQSYAIYDDLDEEILKKIINA